MGTKGIEGRIGGLICFFLFSPDFTPVPWRGRVQLSTGVLSVPSRCSSWGRVQPHHWTHCKLFPSAPLPELSFTLGCCSQSERRRHLHKNFPSTLGTCPVEATTSSISTPQDARHHRVNTQHPPPTAAIFNHLAHSPPRCAYRSFHRAPKRPTSGFGLRRADRRVATPSSAGSTPSLPPGRTGDR